MQGEDHDGTVPVAGGGTDATAIDSLSARLGAAHSLTDILDSLAEAITIRDPEQPDRVCEPGGRRAHGVRLDAGAARATRPVDLRRLHRPRRTRRRVDDARYPVGPAAGGRRGAAAADAHRQARDGGGQLEPAEGCSDPRRAGRGDRRRDDHRGRHHREGRRAARAVPRPRHRDADVLDRLPGDFAQRRVAGRARDRRLVRR